MTDLLSPERQDASTEAPHLNRRPIYLIAAAIILFFTVVIYTIHDTSRRQRERNEMAALPAAAQAYGSNIPDYEPQPDPPPSPPPQVQQPLVQQTIVRHPSPPAPI